MIVYLDSSVIVGRLLGQPNRLQPWGGWSRAYTSELTRVEFYRTLDRLRLQGDLDDEEWVELRGRFEALYGALHRVPLAAAVLARAAESFPTVVASLDAIHLASALAVRSAIPDPIILLSHDKQLVRAASALGFSRKL